MEENGVSKKIRLPKANLTVHVMPFQPEFHLFEFRNFFPFPRKIPGGECFLFRCVSNLLLPAPEWKGDGIVLFVLP